MTTDPILEAALYCLERNYPLPLTAAIVALVDDHALLNDTHAAWAKWDHLVVETFSEVVEELTDEAIRPCDAYGCDTIAWLDETTAIIDVHDFRVCEHCADDFYTCDECGDRMQYGNTVENTTYCDECQSANCSFCDECDEWYLDRNADDHRHEGCDCVAPLPNFQFPANGHGTVTQDERLTVELPKGTIDEEGMRSIRQVVHQAMRTDGCDSWRLGKIMEDVGPVWQGKRGNFTRRLSSAIYKAYKDTVYYKMKNAYDMEYDDQGNYIEVTGWKMPPEVVSEVGNLARAHSSEAAAWHIEFTRDLNQSAEAFYHEDSCWWSTNDSYGQARCTLKNAGGMGLRSYDDDYAHSDRPSGRVWVQPLNADMEVTHDAIGAHAYIIYNGYGDLDGYTPARIVAHLTGKTYRKIEVTARSQYVNNSTGYIVADDATCANTSSILLGNGDPHHQYDAHTVNPNPTTTSTTSTTEAA